MNDANLDWLLKVRSGAGLAQADSRCTAASRIVVHKAVYDQFVNRFVARAKLLKVGDGLSPNTDMGPVVNQQQLTTIISYVALGKQEGPSWFAEGIDWKKVPTPWGFFMNPRFLQMSARE